MLLGGGFYLAELQAEGQIGEECDGIVTSPLSLQRALQKIICNGNQWLAIKRPSPPRSNGLDEGGKDMMKGQ